MITCNGIVGLSLAGRRRCDAARGEFNAEGTATALASVATLATLSLVLPIVHDEPHRPGVLDQPADVRGARVARALRPVRLRPDRSATATTSCRSSSAADDRRRTPTPPTDREALTSLGLLVVALVAVVGLRRRVAGDRGRGRRDRRAAVGGRRRDRAARPAARDAGRGAQRAPGPGADELQPRARLGDGEHRPDDPGDRGRVDLAQGRSCSGSARPRWCCWHHGGRRGADAPARPRDRAGGRRAPRALRRLHALAINPEPGDAPPPRRGGRGSAGRGARSRRGGAAPAGTTPRPVVSSRSQPARIDARGGDRRRGAPHDGLRLERVGDARAAEAAAGRAAGLCRTRGDCDAIRLGSSSGCSAWLAMTSGTPARIAAANGARSPWPATVAGRKSVFAVERPKPGKCLTVGEDAGCARSRGPSRRRARATCVASPGERARAHDRAAATSRRRRPARG